MGHYGVLAKVFSTQALVAHKKILGCFPRVTSFVHFSSFYFTFLGMNLTSDDNYPGLG